MKGKTRRPLKEIDWEETGRQSDYCVRAASKRTEWSVRAIELFFMAHFKCPPKQWFTQLRGGEIKRDVQRLGPKAAASLFGKDPSNYARMYKAAHGHTPREEVRRVC